MKTIIINGFRRGGTNLLWNILCSIPESSTLTLNRNNRQENVEVGEYFAVNSESNFVEFIKNKKLLVVKGVNDDIKFNNLIKKYSSETLEIGLVREKGANCEGWIRRGHTKEEFVLNYNRFLDNLKDNNNLIVEFNTVVNRPFDVINKVCSLLKLPSVDKITIRSKNIYKSVSEYAPAFGKLDDHITLEFNDLSSGYIFKKIDNYQRKNLALDIKEYLEIHCKNFLNEFNSSQYIL